MLIIRPNTTYRSSTTVSYYTLQHVSAIHICHHQVGVGYTKRNIKGQRSFLHSTLFRNTQRDDVNQDCTRFCVSRYYQQLSIAQMNPFRPCLNRSYFAAISLFRSRLLSRVTKIKTLIRPVVSYGAEAWTLTKKNKLR